MVQVTNLSHKGRLEVDDMLYVVSDPNGTPSDRKTSMGDLFATLAEKYDFFSAVIVKCGHCGQWGAAKTSCKTCGAPIDPE